MTPMPKTSRPKFRTIAVSLPVYTILFISLMVSCAKDANNTGKEEILVEFAAFPSTFNFNCTDSPVYEDSILCAKWRGPNNDYIVKPLNRPEKGKYYSWPVGLQIDVNTGTINVSKSESGMLYVIGYVKDGTTDTCHSRIIVAGLHYKDQIYVLSNNDSLA